MSRRAGRFLALPPDMAADVLREGGACRDALIRLLLMRLKPGVPAYQAGLDALDGIAEAITGHRNYFHLEMAPSITTTRRT